MKKRYIYVGASLVAFSVLARTLYKNIYLARQWDFRTTGFRIDKFKPLTVTQKIEFINKSNFKLTIKNIQFGVFSNGIKIGEIIQLPEQTISGKSFSPLQITYALNPKLKSGEERKQLEILAGKALANKDLELDFVGSVDVKGVFGFLRVPIKYLSTGKTLISIYKES